MSSFSRKCNGAFAVNFDLMGGKIVSVPTECHFPVAHFSVGATAVPISPRWKRMIRLECYWIYMIITSWRLILHLVWPVSSTCNMSFGSFGSFHSKLSWTRSHFLGIWAESGSKCCYLDTRIEHYETKQFIVELGLLALHCDGISSKVREYLL